MEMIIKIDEDIIKDMSTCLIQTERVQNAMLKAIENGIVLPENHGKLLDAETVKKMHKESLVKNLVDEKRGLDFSEQAEIPCKFFDEFIDSIPPVTDTNKE